MIIFYLSFFNNALNSGPPSNKALHLLGQPPLIKVRACKAMVRIPYLKRKI